MKLLRNLIARIDNPERSFHERLFILLTITALFGNVIALIGDILCHENPVEIILLITNTIGIPLVTYLSIRFHRVMAGTRLIILILVFVILPVVFIFGGGLEGGCIPWFIFSYLYIGLLLSGWWRIGMLIVLSALSAGVYLLEFLWPEIIYNNTQGSHYVDSYISLVVVGIVIYVMVWFQSRLFREESNRAREETERADELNRAQNRFFSNMSHEIRTPINSILGLNEVILRQEDASPEIIRDATNIQGAGRMLLALINDILDFSKIEAGSMDIVPVDYRVSDLITELVNMILLRTQEKGLKFEVDVDPNTPSVLFGDEVRVKQIIINLLNNAVKYTQSGSIGLHVESERMDEKHVVLLISVSDTGIGIKQDSIPHLFDAFRRADQEKNRNIEGTGLGLAIVHQLVELMEGEVSVNSVYGQGSTFTVSIRQEISDNKALGNLSIDHLGRDPLYHRMEHLFVAPEARVLIVDDNKLNLEVEEKLLKGTKIITDKASSGREALRRTLEEQYDVILMDHLMPEMDGIECLKNLRSQTGGLNNNVPVLVFTANAAGENRELYDASGFDGYLTKPISGRQLEEALLRHIPAEKLILNDSMQSNSGELYTTKSYTRMEHVIFASGSLSDTPELFQKRLNIEILPWKIYTDEGEFQDNVELSADELLRYMEAGKNVRCDLPEISEYQEFFGRLLKKAHHVIYITPTNIMSMDYERATQAAKSFENVSVINSGVLSSSMTYLVLAGYKMMQQNMPVDKIVKELEDMKKRLHSSFIMETADYMANNGRVSSHTQKVAKALSMRPALKCSYDKYGIAGIWMGSKRHCYEKYIKKALCRKTKPDTEILFVTYAAVSEEELTWIEEQVRKRADFENIIFQQASASITANCGPGTFGLMFMDKGPRSYNLGTLIPKVSLAEDPMRSRSDREEEDPEGTQKKEDKKIGMKRSKGLTEGLRSGTAVRRRHSALC